MLLNSTLAGASAVILEYEFLADLVRPFASAYHINMVVNAFDVLGMQTSRPQLQRWIIDREIEALKSADHAFCISGEDREVFEGRGAAAVVIENAIDPESFGLLDIESATRCVARSGYQLPKGRFGLFVGSAFQPNFAAAKRIAELSTNKSLREKGIGFVSAGGCYTQELSEGFPNFSQLGFVSSEALRALYSLASFVIIPLESGTGSSIKTMEAFGYGKAIIGTSVAFRGISVVDRQDCLVIDNLADYPQQIIRLVSGGDLLPALERNAKAIAANRDYKVVYQPIIDALGSGRKEESLSSDTCSADKAIYRKELYATDIIERVI